MNAIPPQGPRAAEAEDLARLAPAPHVPELSDDRRRALKRFLLNEIDRSAPVAAAAPRRSHRRLLASVAVVAAVAAIAAAVVLTGRHTVRELRHPAIASAAEVAANVKTALGSIRTISATVVRPHYDPDGKEVGGERRQIIATADGRTRSVAPAGSPDHMTSDLAAGVKSVYAHDSMNETTGKRADYAAIVTGCPLGMPDRSEQDSDDIDSHLFALWFQGNVMSAMAHGTVTQTTYAGRPALTVTTAADPRVDSPFDAVEVTVDRAAWFPVQVQFLRHGKVREDEHLVDLRLNVPVGDELLEPSFPAGARVLKREASPFWRRVSFAEAAHTYAERPLAPQVLPPAFAPFAAAVTDRARLRFIVATAHGGHDGRYWSWSRDVTSLGYRAGFLTFLVTTRRQATDDPLADPFATVPELAARGSELETVTLTGGALRGVEAQLAMPALNTPHLWAYKDGRLITVSGDLTRDQLLSVANSLKPLE
jgi:outer membrane lipoprotein-sorting protein